jgi:glutaredoxin
LGEDLEALKQLKEATGKKTVPQVFVRGALLGGADDLEAAVAEGR